MKLRDIKGCRYSARYTRYFNRINLLYFDGRLPSVKVYTAPLLKTSAYGTKQLEEDETIWLDAGEYGIVGMESDNTWCIIIDRETSVRHSILSKQTVIHEGIHLDIYPYVGHGIKFKKEIRRVAALGALDSLI